MKKFTKMTALLSAMAMTVCGTLNGFCTAADDTEPKEVKVSFNITDDMSPSKKTDIALFENALSSEGTVFVIPQGTFEKQGFTFSGWTVNGIEGFFGNEIYLIPNDVDEVVFEPVWFDPLSTDNHSITYNLDFHGEIIDYPSWLKDMNAVAGQIITPDYTEIQIEGAYTHGLTIMDGYSLNYGAHFVMPNEDVVVTPIWFKRINFNFYAGDVDRLNGSTMQSFPKNEGSSTDLPASDRFSRDGFNLVGWLSDYDGKIYKPLEIVTCPDVDVTFTAVWEPKDYTVVFKQGNGGANLKVAGKTDTQIICPDPDITVEGKYFAGWQDADGTLYQAGSEYTILGAKPGVGIMLTAVWETGEPPVTTAPAETTTAPAVTTTAPSETTTAPAETTTTAEQVTAKLVGDANNDGTVDLADATAIIQHIGNEAKYALSEQGFANADCTADGKITGADALAIQKLEAGIISELPYIE